VHKDGKVLLHGAVVGEPQPSLSRLARHLDGVAQVIGSLGAPVHYVESVLADLVSQDEQDEDRDLDRISGESTVRLCPGAEGETYTYIRGNKLSNAEGMFEERVDPVKSDQDNARDQAVRGLQPLSVGLVRISWMVSIVACSLRFGDVAISLDPIQSIARCALVQVSIRIGLFTYVLKKHRYVAHIAM
jgi:hypothetical protein